MKVVLDGWRKLRFTKVVEMTPEEFARVSALDEWDMDTYFSERMGPYDVAEEDDFEDMDVTEYKPKAKQ